jgi:hypothetical protein
MTGRSVAAEVAVSLASYDLVPHTKTVPDKAANGKEGQRDRGRSDVVCLDVGEAWGDRLRHVIAAWCGREALEKAAFEMFKRS